MIPRELQEHGEWCVWKREWRGDKPTKIPYDPHTGDKAKSNDPKTFAPYEYAYEVFQTEGEYDGMGLRVSKGYAAVDIDHCIEDGTFSDLSSEIIDLMSSYTEISPSKTGVRIIFRTSASYDKGKYYLKNPQNGVELYLTGMTERFITMTGNTIVNNPVREIADDELTEFCKRYMSRKGATEGLTDEQIIQKASMSAKFQALWSGDMTAYNNDHSSADLALCNLLAFWTGKDKSRMDSLFRRSALYRADKWEREDYRTATIEKAIADTHDVYDPKAAQKIWDRLDVPYLNTGEYTVDGTGVWTDVVVKKEPARVCITPTPIAIARFLENDVHRVELHYLYDNTQRSVVVNREIIANKNKILTLADYGISVNSETALPLVKYLAELERLNPMNIPHLKSCSRLGWLGDNFVPYTESIIFDGEQENKALYQSIAQAGDFYVWKSFTEDLRKNLYVRLMMDASFASVLVEKLNALPFVFHLWGTTSFGKTVSLMVAMSIWGDPSAGKLVRTMNTTNASMMSTAAFLYSIPFAGDELQTIKEQGTTYDKLIMQITEGIERGRMLYNKNLPTRSWHNAFIFTGEDPCTSEKSGGGVMNRVIEIGITDKIIEDGNATVKIVTENYGHAGRKFVDYLKQTDVTEEFNEIYHKILRECDTTDKQAGTAALIILADRLTSRCIYSEAPLEIKDIAPFLKSPKAVNVGIRSQEYIIGWYATQASHFGDSGYADLYGRRERDSVYIIKGVLEKALDDAGFSFDSVKAKWKEDGFLIPDAAGRYVKRKGVGGATPYCVELKMPREEETDYGY